MKVVLTIAGSDSSGGAGIQADLKTFEAFGVFGTSALTVLTAQNTAGVRSIHEVPFSFIKEQIEAVLDDFDVVAIKIGMLFSKEIIEGIGEIIKDLEMPIIFDPVFISKVGSPLLQDDAVDAMQKLFKYATLITPNMHEAGKLFGYDYEDESTHQALHNAPCPVLVKHQVISSANEQKSVDILFYEGKTKIFTSKMLETTNLHGTGCSYSSAITANVALGDSLEDAITASKEFIYEAIKNAPNIGHGAGPINHKKGRKC